MSDVVLSPNMSLPVPIVGLELGPTWANDINACLGILDQHNHSNGQGVQITPAGININTDLPMNGNNLTLVNSVRFNNLLSTLPGSAPNLGVVYEALGNLYFNDAAGNVIKITSAGAVNATSSGISSGTATASFSGGVLVVDSNVNTPANIQAGSILIGNNVASSNYATLQAPSSLGANYSLTLPPTNGSGSTVFLTYDTSNNEGIGPAVQNGITRSNLAAVGQQISASCGAFTWSTPSTPTNVTNLSVTITTSGRPVMVMLQDDGTVSGGSYISQSTTGGGVATLSFVRGVTEINEYIFKATAGGTQFWPVSLVYLDTPTAGTYTYTVSVATGSSMSVNDAVLVAYEL
jgi:hypothetical protein